MTYAFPRPNGESFTPPSMIIDAIRCWRSAHDDKRPIQPALFAKLSEYRCGIIAPAFDSVMRFYEACSGRQIRVGGPNHATLSVDEHELLDLLDEPTRLNEAIGGVYKKLDLLPAMRIALRSTRLMMNQALFPAGDRVIRSDIMINRLG